MPKNANVICEGSLIGNSSFLRIEKTIFRENRLGKRQGVYKEEAVITLYV